jgi:hypothetical protein
MEVHYYHVHEVWHALYNRAEERHLRDPENKEVKDEDARRRQLDTHEGIMDVTFKDLRNRVANTAEFDATLRQAYSKPSTPIQAYEHFTVTLVQQRVRRQQQRNRRKEHEALKKHSSEHLTSSQRFARELLERKQEAEEAVREVKKEKRKKRGGMIGGDAGRSSPDGSGSPGANRDTGNARPACLPVPCTASIALLSANTLLDGVFCCVVCVGFLINSIGSLLEDGRADTERIQQRMGYERQGSGAGLTRKSQRGLRQITCFCLHNHLASATVLAITNLAASVDLAASVNLAAASRFAEEQGAQRPRAAQLFRLSQSRPCLLVIAQFHLVLPSLPRRAAVYEDQQPRAPAGSAPAPAPCRSCYHRARRPSKGSCTVSRAAT